MKATLEFELPEDREELDDAIKAGDYKTALWQTQLEVFRPARKHGYRSQRIQELLDSNPNAVDLVWELEQLFLQILKDHQVDLD